MPAFPFTRQFDAKDCGPACLKMIAEYYGKMISLQSLRELSSLTKAGTNLLGISNAAESLGFRTIGARISSDVLMNEIGLPCIAHLKQGHFVVIYKVSRRKIYVADPAQGLLSYGPEQFLDNWSTLKEDVGPQGVVLMLEPTPEFEKIAEEEPQRTSAVSILLIYLARYKKLLMQLLLGVLFGNLLNLVFPFLTQAIVDYGINVRDISFIVVILFAQLALTSGRTTVDLVRSWILLHVSTRVSISFISDFLKKLMGLPISFFDQRTTGDILQRINDYRRIEAFMTSFSLDVPLSLISLVVFAVVLALYNVEIFSVFMLGSLVYMGWVIAFIRKRREYDFKRFAQLSDNQTTLLQIIAGMQEIKLNNAESAKRWQWERIQARLFNVNVKSLSLEQYQQAGAIFINETKNILITYLAAMSVVKGEMTLGMMMAVQYIIGQLNAPIQSLLAFARSIQDARISFERLKEIYALDSAIYEFSNERIPSEVVGDIILSHVSFRYAGSSESFVLQDISLALPRGKVTAVVGASGSGKTTMMKLILGFYEPTNGDIRIGGKLIGDLGRHSWRENCGVVLQDGFIFSDTLAGNIALGSDRLDKDRLNHAIKTANLVEFVHSLPNGTNTTIGDAGHGLSQGQKQRVLIARAIYKQPSFLFLDEATNSLDAENELIIVKNLKDLFGGKTVMVIAHRLSTVKNADNIIVLNSGRIEEQGSHDTLIQNRHLYFNLVHNQLELGGE